MKAFLKQLRRYFDRRCAVVDDVWGRYNAGTLTTSHPDVYLVLTALTYATYDQFKHRVDGKNILLETRIKNVDDYLLQLNIVNQALQDGKPPSDWSHLLDSQIRVSLYDFLVSNEGYVIPLTAAVKRSIIPTIRYLVTIDELILDESPQLQFQLDKTEMMRVHLLEVMLAFLSQSDQVKSMPQQ